jgi:hypothetical protein
MFISGGKARSLRNIPTANFRQRFKGSPNYSFEWWKPLRPDFGTEYQLTSEVGEISYFCSCRVS